ncbi:substrate-binding periplasmic protein [Aestuariispira insulae]|uniref:Polar amino acid transport system substrate-binding protein n=1 Tax=Aestuariispira insulae TaxID=1461337 RepID=A0A3D9H9L0_9PROT|nr:transporter substrate-binding domain-containing protein [Aestuariispira insulae]RED46165.1 polar amino acid transport system substrate-binding protein [Aestuariispira insulae]
MIRPILLALVLLSVINPTRADGRPVHVVTLEFPPYVSENLPQKGWAWEVCATILKEAGYEPHLQILPWARALALTRDGKADALYLANINEERRQWAVFTDPVGEEVSVPFGRIDLKAGQDLLTLRGTRVGGLRGAHVLKILSGQGVEIYPVITLEQGFRMVLVGRLDMLVTDRYVGMHLLQTGMPPQYHQNIVPLDIAIDSNQLHLAISRKAPDHDRLQEDFNMGLAELRASGRYQAILGHHGF